MPVPSDKTHASSDRNARIMRALHASDDEDYFTRRQVLHELRQLRAEVAELSRALLPGTSPLILGAEAAAEFRRITGSTA